MIFADTNYFQALAQSSDSMHKRAAAWAGSIPANETLIVSEYVLFEVMNSLSKPRDRSKAHVLRELITTKKPYRLIYGTAQLLNRSIQLHVDRTDKYWSLTDCASFVIMAEMKITRALTHDHHFEQAGFEALLRRDPP